MASWGAAGGWGGRGGDGGTPGKEKGAEGRPGGGCASAGLMIQTTLGTVCTYILISTVSVEAVSVSPARCPLRALLQPFSTSAAAVATVSQPPSPAPQWIPPFVLQQPSVPPSPSPSPLLPGGRDPPPPPQPAAQQQPPPTFASLRRQRQERGEEAGAAKSVIPFVPRLFPAEGFATRAGEPR